MTWTATERTFDNDIGPQTLVIDIRKTSTDLVCQLWADADDDAAIEQMRARTKLIVQAERMRGMLEIVLDWVGNWDPNFAADDDWIEDEKTIRAIIKATGGENE